MECICGYMATTGDRSRDDAIMQRHLAEVDAAAEGEQPMGRSYPSASSVILVRWRGMLWDKCTLRKLTSCIYCGKSLPPKTAAWRPVTNGMNRMHRLCCYPRDAYKLESQSDEMTSATPKKNESP